MNVASDIKRKKHKQNKYFTIMLIPYSGGKTRSIKIPHWFSYLVFSAIFCLVSFLTFSLVRNNSFYQTVQSFNTKLAEKEFEKNSLELKTNQLEDEKKLLKEKNTQIEHNLTTKEEQYNWKLLEYKKQIEEMEAKIEEIEQEKNKIYDLISKSVDIPDEFMTLAVGGIYTDGLLDSNFFYEQEFEAELLVINDAIERLALSFEFLNKSADKYKDTKDSIPSGWPVNGIITSEVGYRRDPFKSSNGEFHSGLDLAVPIGTDVLATANGEVTFAGYNSGYGYLVKVKHINGIETYYAHNSKVLVSVGDYIKKGDVVAKSGNTGRSTGPHVHYEVRLDNVVKNPRDYY